MIQLPSCSYAVPIGGSAIVELTTDKPAFLEWLNTNIEGGYCMVASTAPLSVAVPRGGLNKGGQIDDHVGAIFMFETYKDALLFKMRFGG